MVDTTKARLELPLFAEGSKDEMQAHLRKFHRMAYHINSKTPKVELAQWHDQVHEKSDTGTEENKREYGRFVLEPHVHIALSAESFRAAGGTQLDLKKPLTASEASALKTLIDNDFDALKADMQAMASDERISRQNEVTKEWNAKQDRRAAYMQKANELAVRYTSDIDALVEKAKNDGVKLAVNRLNSGYVNAELVGKSEALNVVDIEISNDLNRALIALDRQRLLAQRTVILARVTPEAAKVLDTIPDAKTLMVEAAKERATKQEITG